MIEKIHKLKKSGKRIGFTASTAELAHPGFIDMLLQAKKDCDFLIFGLLTDPTISRPTTKNKPVETTFERWVRLSAIKYIDMIIPFDTEEDLENMIQLIQPSVRFVGEEYKDTKHTGWNLCPISYNTRHHSWSSSSLRRDIYDAEHEKQLQKRSLVQNDEIKIPKTLSEAYFILETFDGIKKWLRLDEKSALAMAHNNIGMAIRNDWGLWTNGPLKDYFKTLGITHPDDMSSIILTSFHRLKNGKEADVDGQVAFYKAFWNSTETERHNYFTTKLNFKK
jgi:glycerol-3-phosphate cytidylyltransferase